MLSSMRSAVYAQRVQCIAGVSTFAPCIVIVMLEMQRGRIVVNDKMQVLKYAHIMAIGDLIEGVGLSRQLNIRRMPFPFQTKEMSYWKDIWFPMIVALLTLVVCIAANVGTQSRRRRHCMRRTTCGKGGRHCAPRHNPIRHLHAPRASRSWKDRRTGEGHTETASLKP